MTSDTGQSDESRNISPIFSSWARLHERVVADRPVPKPGESLDIRYYRADPSSARVLSREELIWDLAGRAVALALGISIAIWCWLPMKRRQAGS
ncbi:MAG: hypothetical protein HY673_13885 [Chloroflexi bacterium]|nr:hypothetical protein [Chloroflexota bacterium]